MTYPPEEKALMIAVAKAMHENGPVVGDYAVHKTEWTIQGMVVEVGDKVTVKWDHFGYKTLPVDEWDLFVWLPRSGEKIRIREVLGWAV